MILIVQNDPEVPAGHFGELLRAWKIPHVVWHAEDGAAPPLSGVSGLIVLGGYMGVHETDRFPFLRDVQNLMRSALARDLPTFGICLGGQLLAGLLGAPVHPRRHGERGCTEVRITAAGAADPLFAGLGPVFPTLEWHHDSFEIPAGAVHLAATEVCPGQAFRAGRGWGVQFHPEVDAAIVAAWTEKTGADRELLAGFRRREEELAEVAATLLGNFLRIAGMAIDATGMDH